MKLIQQLFVNNEPVQIHKSDIRLDLSTPGRASFIVVGQAQKGIAFFDMGYDKSNLHRVFVGYVESIIPINNNHHRLFCRELSAALNRRLPLSLRHPTLNDTLKKVSELTALKFVVPQKEYANRKAATINAIGSGYHLLDSLKAIYDIDQYVWQQQTNGDVFVGSWLDSRQVDNVISIDKKWFTQQGPINTAQLPTIPRMRPGMHLDGLGVLTSVNFISNQMKIKWSKNPWKKPSKR